MNNSKKSLLMSTISLLLCISMFIGSTFAWFTDSASSAGNKIHSGILKLDVELLDKKTGEWNSLKNTQEPIFNYDKWEPGYMDAKVFKVQNEGNLALKWVAKFYSEYELSILADVIDVYVRPSDSVIGYPTDRNLEGYTCVGNLRTFINSIEDTTYGTLEPEQESYLGIALKMREEAGNEYQGLSLGGAFDIRIYATQHTLEYDSFGNNYDTGATFDELANTSIMANASETLATGADSVDFDLSSNGLYVAKVIVPASAIADTTQPVSVTFDGIKPSETSIVDENTQAYAFDIKVANLKDNLVGDQLVTVIVTAPNALAAMKAYHNGTLIEDAVYDEVEGTITFKTANFSPYDFTSQVQEVSDLTGLRDALQKDGHTAKLMKNITVDLTKGSGDARAEAHAYSGYYNGVIINGKSVGLDLNGYNITALCGDSYNSNSDVGALFFVGENGSLNITNTGNVSTGFIKMRSSIYAVWAPFDTPSYVDIYGGAFIADSYASDPIGTSTNAGSAEGTMQNENSNRALIYAGFGGKMNVYGGYFLYNNTPNDVLNRNNGAFNAKDHYSGSRPLLVIHDGVMLINNEYRQNPANTSTPNGTFDENSVQLEANCGITKVEDRATTIDSVNYATWYRVTSNVPVSLVVKGLQEVYARNDIPKFTVTVKYTYGSKAVTNYQMTEVDMTTAGIKNATITYTENGKTLTTDISFKVNAVSSIVVEPKQDVFDKGTTLSKEHFAVRAVTNEGKSTTVTNFTISSVNTSTVGEKTVTITYDDNGVKFTATCKIMIKNIKKVSANDVSLHGWNAGQFIAGSNWVSSYYDYNGKTYTGENGEKATGFNITGHVGSIELGKPNTGYGSLTVTNAKPYTKVGHWGWISFDNYKSIEMGYYFDGDVTTYVQGVAIHSGITTSNPDYNTYGPNCHNYQLEADLTSFAPGTSHTVTFVVATDAGILDLCTWNVTMANETKDSFVDTAKPNVNVVILAGQSNACGPTPITSNIRNQYGNHDFSNVYIHYRNTGWDGSQYAIATQNAGFDKYQLGIGGWQSYYFGPELGLAYTLSTQATGEQWYIIKYAPTGTCLATEWLSGANLTSDMIDYVKKAIDMLDDAYDVQIRSFMWMQGESDATSTTTANPYATNEQALVSKVRTELAAYATRSSSAPSVAGSGIAFVSAGIAPNGRADGIYATTGKYVSNGGPNDWIYATYVNQAKQNNCQLWYLPTVTVEGSVFTPGIPAGLYDNNPGHKIKNSIFIDTAALSSKAVATGEHGEYTIESDKSDWAHYNANSMNNLGHWFGASVLCMLNK